MALLSESDKTAFRESARWTEPVELRRPRVPEATPQARARYCRWATEAAKFFKGEKPVRFEGQHWKL